VSYYSYIYDENKLKRKITKCTLNYIHVDNMWLCGGCIGECFDFHKEKPSERIDCVGRFGLVMGKQRTFQSNSCLLGSVASCHIHAHARSEELIFPHSRDTMC
jgi:hypothetical protein